MVPVRTRFCNLRTPTGGNETAPRELVVEGGRLVAVTPAGQETAAEGEQWVDLGGALVLPGAIDGHVHFDDPGFTHRESFSTGTAAAAAGGVTCVVDMPCTSVPPVIDTLALANKLLAITPKAHVDFMLWGGVSANALEQPDWRDRLDELAGAGIAAIKVYLLSGMDSFRHLSVAQLREVLGEARRLGVPVGVHAEDADTVREEESLLRRRGLDSPRAYADSRPPVAEVRAVETVIEACRQTGARAHVVHLASGEALDRLSAARRDGCPITAETCPHFLEFTVEDLESMGSLLKTAPVVKSAADRSRLWQGLAEGELAFVATDHAAGQWPDEKQTGSIWTDYGGVPGVELLLPYLYSEGVRRGRLSLTRLAQVLSSGPARFFGIDHRKGALKPGLDADFVVLDDAKTWTVRAHDLHNLNRYTPFEGRRFTGRVRATYLRGRCVFERRADGTESFAPAGTGEFVQRGAA
jgi:allantoinase